MNNTELAIKHSHCSPQPETIGLAYNRPWLINFALGEFNSLSNCISSDEVLFDNDIIVVPVVVSDTFKRMANSLNFPVYSNSVNIVSEDFISDLTALREISKFATSLSSSWRCEKVNYDFKEEIEKKHEMEP